MGWGMLTRTSGQRAGGLGCLEELAPGEGQGEALGALPPNSPLLTLLGCPEFQGRVGNPKEGLGFQLC